MDFFIALDRERDIMIHYKNIKQYTEILRYVQVNTNIVWRNGSLPLHTGQPSFEDSYLVFQKESRGYVISVGALSHMEAIEYEEVRFYTPRVGGI